MSCFRSERDRRYYELPRQAWERILLWLPPVTAIRSGRVCRLTYSLTQTDAFWLKKYKWDFHGSDPLLPTDYRQLTYQLWSNAELRRITMTSFGIKNKDTFRYHLKPNVATCYVDHVNRLNQLRYRGKPLLRIRHEKEYRTEHYCKTCNSANLYVGSRYSNTTDQDETYYICRNSSCRYKGKEIHPGSRRVFTGLYTVEVFHRQGGCCSIL